MNTVTTVKPRLRLTDRLSFRLLVLFLGVFLLVFLALAAWSISWSFAESALAEAGAASRPQPIVIDPKLRDELAAVMSLDTVAEPVSIKDPFADRTGIVGLSNAQRAVGGVVTTTGGSGGATSSGTLASSGAAPGRSSGTTVVPGSSVVPGGRTTENLVPPSEATKQRYVIWLERAALGDIPLDPRIFAIDDLLPVGVVDGGNGSQEVMFYSEAAGKTISFPVGTMFYDGWIAELRPEGVVFGSGTENKQYRLRSWARSLRNVG
jgi:hypothetical protein